jgi:hypothetical protein
MDIQALLQQLLQGGGGQQQQQPEEEDEGNTGTWGGSTTNRIQAYADSPGDYKSFEQYVLPAFRGMAAPRPQPEARSPSFTQPQAAAAQPEVSNPLLQEQSGLDYNAIAEAPDWDTLKRLMMQRRQSGY